MKKIVTCVTPGGNYSNQVQTLEKSVVTGKFSARSANCIAAFGRAAAVIYGIYLTNPEQL